MLRGCQREMVMLRTEDSEIFESAWLVLRREKRVPTADEMLAEANRIIGLSGARRSQKRGVGRLFLAFAAGALTGVLLFAAICFFVGV